MYKYYNKTREGYNFGKAIGSIFGRALRDVAELMGPVGKIFKDDLKKSKKSIEHQIFTFGFTALKILLGIGVIVIIIVTSPISIPFLFFVIIPFIFSTIR